MRVLVFHNDQLLGTYSEWQHSDTLPKPSYIYDNKWYIVNTYGGVTPINLSDVPPLCLKILQMLNLVVPK